MRTFSRRVGAFVAFLLLGVSFVGPSSATTITAWDGAKAYLQCGNEVPYVSTYSYGSCAFPSDNTVAQSRASGSADHLTGRVSANVAADSTLPAGFTLVTGNARLQQPQAWARIIKKVAVSQAGNVTVNYENIVGSTVANFTNLPWPLYYPPYTSSHSSYIKLEAIFYYYPCALGGTCGPTATRSVSKYISTTYGPGNGPTPASTDSLTFNNANPNNSQRGVPGAGYINIEMGVYTICDASGPANTSASVSADVVSLVVP